MDDGRLYFDNAATSFPKPVQVYEALDAYVRGVGGTAGRSAHERAQAGSRLLFELREALAELCGGADDRVVLTKNATEAINLALSGLARPGATIVHGPLEHNAVMRPLTHLAQRHGWTTAQAPGDALGRIEPTALDAFLAQTNADVLITLYASNVHGLAQDLAAIGEICARREIIFIVDGAQGGGLLPLDMDAMRIDALCLTGHKGLLGPTGTGALLLSERGAERIQPLLLGGTGSASDKEAMPDFLPDRLEAGTPNTHGAAGLLAGVQYLLEETIEVAARYEAELRARMIERMRALKGVTIIGDAAGPATATLGITSRLAPSDMAFLLSEKYGVAVRAGLQCAPRAHRTLGTFPDGTVRLAPGLFTPPSAVDEVADAIGDILRTQR
ncbi:MAG TPA: aminotransferase class V-fold PLP-dependent enzyme [bacterium]|nr:aminotransferase class V-fold PLP-dependent enzyme [bacterium]